jgi:hypothetical protein
MNRGWRNVVIREKSAAGQTLAERTSEAAIAEFIRTRGVTRCPTACVLPTQGSVAPHDKAALAEYAAARAQARRARAAQRNGFFAPSVPRPPA